MPREVQLFWSMQSAYCYVLLDRVLELDRRPDVQVVLRPVLPGVLRIPKAYVERGALEAAYFDLDARRTVAFLNLPYAEPDPSPVAFEPRSMWRSEAEQPRVAHLYGLLMAATWEGHGLAFLDQVMRLLWDGRTKGWDTGTHLAEAIARAGIDPAALAERAAKDRAKVAADLAENNAALQKAGHWACRRWRSGAKRSTGRTGSIS